MSSTVEASGTSSVTAPCGAGAGRYARNAAKSRTSTFSGVGRSAADRPAGCGPGARGGSSGARRRPTGPKPWRSGSPSPAGGPRGSRARPPPGRGAWARRGRGPAPQMCRAREVPEVRRPSHPDRPDHRHLARVIRRLRELPRAELTVQIAQVRGGGDGRLLGIEPLVHPPVDAQTVAARRGRHELPEPFRADAGDGARVEAAFDHRREGEIHRQALTPEDLPDHREVASGSRSEEHTSELQSRLHLVCRLLLEKKKKKLIKTNRV